MNSGEIFTAITLDPFDCKWH